MAQTRTKPFDDSVGAFIARIEDPVQRADAASLVAMMQRVTGEEPRLWNGGIVGFGDYHYRYDSGHEGDTALVGFAPRKAEFSIYLTGTYLPEQGTARGPLLARSASIAWARRAST